MTQNERKAAFKDMLVHVKLKTGVNNDVIAKKLKYSTSYLSKVLTEGVPEVLIKKFEKVFEEELRDFRGIKFTKPDHTDQAILKALLTDYIKLKAQITKRKVEDVAEELEQNTKLILRDLNR